MPLRETLQGALVMAPMTKGSNLPYRQLCQELGARVTMSEMTVARRLKQKRRSEFALIRRAPDERFFGVQLAGNNPDEMAWAAQLVESRGANLVDVNLGCPIDFFTSKGLGAALAREPKRVRRIVAAMKLAVQVPVTVKIRLGWNDEHRNYLDVARAAVEGGADAIFVHGRTRAARYTMSADWNAIGDVAAAVPVPVIGNGDLLFRHDIDAAFGSGCTAVMTARGALIKPWLFREATEGDLDLSGEERLEIYRRYVALAKGHWGADEHGVGTNPGVPAVAHGVLVPLRAAARRWHLSRDAAARILDSANAARSAARPIGRAGPRISRRSLTVRGIHRRRGRARSGRRARDRRRQGRGGLT